MKTPAQKEEIIRSWMTLALEAGIAERFDDIHVGRIDPEWNDKGLWLEAGLQAFRIATGLRSREGLSADVALAFSLRSGAKPLGVNFRSAAGLQAQFDWSPPSLYLIGRGEEPWAHGMTAPGAEPPAGLSVTKLEPKRIGMLDPVRFCGVMEFRQAGSAEFCRTLLLAG
jgi:hypothetical protein